MLQEKTSSRSVSIENMIREYPVIDLGTLSGCERVQALETFEGIAAGGSFEISARRRLTLLFCELRDRFGAGFYWWPLERGPLVWRVMLAKPAQGAQPTVATVMSADHHRLHKLWCEFESAVELCQIETVHRRLSELSLGLRRYIDIEEVVLFPLLEAQTRRDDGNLTAAMRSQHREIAHLLDQFDKLRLTKDCASILQAFDQPVEPMAIFRNHYRNEEAVLYPLMEKVFSPVEERELLSLIQAFEI
ncbi:MAG: hemerythrin domain-containing protein [Candidatus Binataceae bacterium]